MWNDKRGMRAHQRKCSFDREEAHEAQSRGEKGKGKSFSQSVSSPLILGQVQNIGMSDIKNIYQISIASLQQLFQRLTTKKNI